MCLDTVDKNTKKDVKYGYKVFHKLFQNELYPLWNSLPKKKHFKQIGWNIDRRKYFIRSSSDNGYECGFHIFENQNDACDYLVPDYFFSEIHKVEVKDIVASGTQLILCNNGNGKYINVIICKKFKILEEITNYETEI